MSTLAFYREQAARCRKEALVASLANVRALNTDAALAWDAMADRLVRTESHREMNEAAKARGSETFTLTV